MSDPYGTYTFAGLGFTGLLFLPISDGYLSYGEGSRVRLNSATYDDADGVTFSASESPVGAFNLKFVGSLIFDMSGNVIGMAGTWTGTAFIFNLQTAAHVEPVIQKIPPFSFPITFAHGPWSANRQPP
jgi:hypothetical protein